MRITGATRHASELRVLGRLSRQLRRIVALSRLPRMPLATDAVTTDGAASSKMQMSLLLNEQGYMGYAMKLPGKPSWAR